MSCFASLSRAIFLHTPKPWKKSQSLLHPSTSRCNATASDAAASPDPLIGSIITLSSLDRLPEAFTAFSLLLRHHHPSPLLLIRPLSSLLSSSTNLRAHPPGTQLHAHIVSLGLLRSPTLAPRLTSFYIALGLLPDASSTAESSTCLLSWNLLISAYIRDGLPSSALLSYKQMVKNGLEPDCFTYPSVIKACSETLDIDLGKEIHCSIESGEIGWNLFVWNALVAMYAKCGDLGAARKLFDEMPERDVVSWNSMISGYASRRMWREAFELFGEMRAVGSAVNSVTWNTVIGGKLQMGRHTEALELVSQMRRSGAGFDFVTFVVGLNACSRIGCVRLGKELHGLMIRFHFDVFESARNALITMYSRCKGMEHANVLFQTAGIRSVVTWNTMIAGFAIADQAEEASVVFRDMVRSGVRPNYVTIVTILSLCARVTNLQHGRELHCFITKQGFKDYRLLWNSLVDMYSKSGWISIARKVFDTMTDRDEVSYTSLIAGYGMQGEGNTALELFDEMIGCGIKPDHITMVAVLSACSHCGLVSKGEAHFNRMVDTYGIEPQMEHFSCMVDLYSRARLLQNAEELLGRTTFKPTAAMWAALVGACQVHRNTEIGARAARKLMELRTDNAGHYVLIANMYADAGCWEELANVRTLMRDLGVRKVPGCAWVDLGNGFNPFMVGDRSSPMAPEIYLVLDGLFEQMCDAGYVANEELGLDEEDCG